MKKRMLSLWLAVAMLISLLPTTALAATPGAIFSSTASSAGNKANDTFEVKVQSDAITGAHSVAVKISFDKNVFEVVEIEWNTTIPSAAKSGVENANENGFFAGSYTDSTNNAELKIDANTTFVTATLKVKPTAAVGNATVTLTDIKPYDEYSRLIPVTPNTSSINVGIISEITGVQAIAGVDAPVKGAAPDTQMPPPSTFSVSSIKWYAGEQEFTGSAYAGNTVYTAELTLIPNTNYVFSDSATYTINGEAATRTSFASDRVVIKKAFPKTEAKALTGITIDSTGPVAVPTAAPNQATYTELALTATGAYDDGTFAAISPAWSIDGNLPTGVSLEGSTLKVSNSAAAGSVTVKGILDGKEQTKQITITKASPQSTVLLITGEDSVDVPIAANNPKTYTDAFTATCYDQFGKQYDSGTITWSLDPAYSGIEIQSTSNSVATLTVSKGAAAGSVTIKATSSNGPANTKSVTVNKAVPVPTTVTLAGGASTVAVPTVADGGTTSTAAFTATVKDQFDADVTSPTVKWSLMGSHTGVSINESTGVLTITKEAAASSVTVKATSGTASGTQSVTITKAASVATAIKIYKAGTEVPADTVLIPSAGNTEQIYTAKVFDQFGAEKSETANWAITPAGAGVTVSGGTVAVAYSATAQSYTLTATSSTVSGVKSELVINVMDKTEANVSFTGTPPTVKTYGDGTFTVTAAAANSGTGNGAWTWTSSDSTVLSVSGTSATATVTILKAGSAIITASYESDTTAGSATTASITVSPKTLTIAGVSATERVYNGTTDVTLTGGTLNGKVGSDEVEFNLGTGTIADKNVGTAKAVTTNITLTGAKASNYTLTQPSVTVKITPQPLTITYTGAPLTKKFNNTTAYAGEIALTLAGLVTSDSSGTLKANGGTYNSKDVATANQLTLGALTATGFTLTNYSYTLPTPAATITKADAPVLADITVSQKFSVTSEQTEVAGRAGMPENAGTLTYAKGSESTSGTATVSSWSVDHSGNVKYTITAGQVGAVITLPVTITSQNYAESTVLVKITLTAKDVPTVNAGDITVTYTGNPVPASKITGTATFNGAPVTGTWSWKVTTPGQSLTDVAHSGEKTVVFTPTDTVNYAPVEKTIRLTIQKATPTGTPAYTAITASGKKLADADLKIGSIKPIGGVIAWDDATTTEVKPNIAYGWTYTPTDINNYNKLTGTLTPYYIAPPISITQYTLSFETNGGSKLDAVTKNSGETVDLSGFVSTREGYTFGGWYSDKELTKAATSVKLTGNTTVYAKWLKITPFTDVKADAYYKSAVDWAVEMGITEGTSATTFGPNDACTRAQAVTFLWRANGSPEPGSSDNPFTDVREDAYYYKAVLWVVEKGITEGTSATTFSPNEIVSRAQTVTFLWRAAGMPAQTDENPFADVKTGAYYENAVLWAAEEKITEGTSATTFTPASNCVRAQLVTFLWRTII